MQFTDLTVLALALSGIAVAVETIVEVIKALLKDTYPLSDKAKFFASTGIGIILTVLLHISLFETDNQVLFYLGSALAGAIASRGANRAHEILDVIRNLKK